MEIKVTRPALKWFEENINFDENKYLRFVPRLKRKTKTGLSIMPVKPTKIHTSFVHNGITYYIEEADIWFFPGESLTVRIKNQEPSYEWESV